MDTRIEDMRRAGWSEALIDRAIASPQTGSQAWMNRPAGLNREQYLELADKLKALFTEDEIKAMSTAENAQAFAKDPIAYLAKFGRYQEFVTKFLQQNP